MKSKTYTENKQLSDKTQSSKFCHLGFKAGFHLKAVFMSFNVAFVPISRSRFKQCQIAPLRTFTNVLRFCVNFWMIFGHSVNEIFFLKG